MVHGRGVARLGRNPASRKAISGRGVLPLCMTRPPSPDPYLEAKLLGIMLSGVFGQTRPECSVEALPRADLKPSGVYRVVLPTADEDS